MRKRPRTYSPEFKLDVVQQWEAGERSCAQLVREHGVGQSVLYRWRDAYREHGDDAFSELAVSRWKRCVGEWLNSNRHSAKRRWRTRCSKRG